MHLIANDSVVGMQFASSNSIVDVEQNIMFKYCSIKNTPEGYQATC